MKAFWHSVFEGPSVKPAAWILAIAIAMGYAGAVQSSFKTLDDDFSIVRNVQLEQASSIPGFFTSSFFGGQAYYRPLVMLSFFAERQIFGLRAAGYYVDNILLHIANAIWVLLIFVSLGGERHRTWAVAAAWLYGLHPIHWEAVSNIAGRSILLSAFFSLSALMVIVRRGIQGLSPGRCALVCGLYSLALLSKESALVFPAVGVWYALIMERRQPWTRAFLRLFLPLLMLTVFYGIWRSHLGITQVFLWRSPHEAVLGFLTFLRSLLTHLKLMVFPVDLYFDRAQRLFVSWKETEALFTLGVWSCVVFVVVRRFRKWPDRVKFLLGWSAIELLPVSQLFVSIGVQPGFIAASDHFLYLSAVGQCGVLAWLASEAGRILLDRRWISPAVLTVGMAGYGVFLFAMLMTANLYSSQEIAMFERSLAGNPHNSRIRNSLAMAYARLGRFSEAEKHFRQVLRQNPLNTRARIGLGKALVDQGRFWEGLAEYDRVFDAGGLKELLEGNKAAVYAFLDTRYRDLCRKDPVNARAWYSWGVVAGRQGRFVRARDRLLKAVALNPDFPEAWYNLGAVYEGLGQAEKARTAYEKFLAMETADDDLRKIAHARLQFLSDADKDNGM